MECCIIRYYNILYYDLYNAYVYIYIYTHTYTYSYTIAYHNIASYIILQYNILQHRVYATCFIRDSLRGSSVKLGTIRRVLAWPLRKDGTRRSRSVNHNTC